MPGDPLSKCATDLDLIEKKKKTFYKSLALIVTAGNLSQQDRVMGIES